MAPSERQNFKALRLSLLFCLGLSGPGLAQDDAESHGPATPANAANDYDEISKLIDSIQTRVDKMNASAKDTDAAMAFLSDQVEAAVRKLSSRETENLALRGNASGLSDELKAVAATRDELRFQVTRLSEEKNEIFEQLEGQVRELASLLSLEYEMTANLRKSIDDRSAELSATLDERDRIANDLGYIQGVLTDQRKESEARLRRIAALEQDVAELRGGRAEVESRLTAKTAALKTNRASLDRAHARNAALDDELIAVSARAVGLDRQLAEARDGHAALESRLADETAARKSIQASLEQSRTRNRAIDGELIAAGARMETLTRQLAALRTQIAKLIGLLDASEGDNKEQQEVIADLGRRLNLALAAKVRELAKYRSEFLGRLREVLGERSDVRIVGDRFVFQSEVLFRTGEAELEEPGREQLHHLAESLQQIADTIPADIDWVLRIDGHTDERSIQTPRFPSNWELSTARAISVVRFLIKQGVSASRLMAAGFAHFRPLVPGRDEVAFRRNRRIEFRLTAK